MIVCSCFGMTDREIRAAFGPDGPGKCMAGHGCGNCVPVVRAIQHEAQQRDEQTSPGADGDDRRSRIRPGS